MVRITPEAVATQARGAVKPARGSAVLVAGASAAVLISLAAIAPLAAALGLFAVMSWFALPGVLLARRLYGSDAGWAGALLSGPAWGYVLSSLVLLALWAAGVRAFVWLLLAPIPAAAAAWPARRLAPYVSPPTVSRGDIAAIAFVLLAVPAIVGRPYSRVGVDLPDGRAYRAYFTADFVWEMTVAAEVSKGDVPPQSPFYPHDALHYYWLMHLLPGAEHRAGGSAVRLDDILLTNALWVGLVFVAFLYWFVRHFVESPWAAAIACVFVLFCSSFEGADRLWNLWQRHAPLGMLRSINIDAVANWFYQGMKVDGLHRALLYQPQHQLGYVLGFSALLLLVEARDASRAGLLFLVGVFLGLSMLLSTVAAGILAVAAAAYEALRLIRARRWKASVPCALAAAVPIGAVLALIRALQYVDTASSGTPLVRFGLNGLAAHRVMWTMFLNFGPVLAIAALGVVGVLGRRAIGRLVPLAIVLGTSAVFYFWVDIPEHDSVYVAWRASHIAFIALAAVCAAGLQAWWGRGRAARGILTATCIIVAVAALPTVVIDLYNTQDVTNRAMGPGFQWTVVLSPPELEAFDWMKRNTLPDARVQIEPYVRERDAYYVTAFGERRMAGGLPTGLIPLAKYRALSTRIRDAYRSTSAADAYRRAVNLCIDYLVIGPPERAAYPTLQPLVDNNPHLFRPAFRNEKIAIYAVSPPPGAAAGCR